MDKTPAEIAAVIHQRADVDLEPMRRYLAAAVGTDRQPVRTLGPSIAGPSIEVDDAEVTAAVSMQDPQYLGTFDRTAEPRMILVAVNARRPAQTPSGAPRTVDLPVREQTAWVRIVLGDLADYAYRIVTDLAQLRVRPAFFVVLVDSDATPRLAPRDFNWALAGSGGRRAYPEKVVPQNSDLLRHLRRHGDLIDPDTVPRPQERPPGVWALEFVSYLTANLADRIGRLGDDRQFTFEEVRLHGRNRVVVRYIWHLIGEDRKIALDIDLDGVRAHRRNELDDPRARTAAHSVAGIFVEPPQFRSATVVDGVTWVRIGASD